MISAKDRVIESLDERVSILNGRLEQSMQVFLKELIERGSYTYDDPTSISIIPRIISRDEHRRIGKMCTDLTRAAFYRLSEYLEDRTKIPGSKLNDFLKTLPIGQRVLTGSARYDFLKQGEDYKLVEMNFVNIGALRECTESSAAILGLFPDLQDDFYYLSPVRFMRKRLLEQEINSAIILTRDDYSDQPSDAPDRPYIDEKTTTIDTAIVHERDYKNIGFKNGKLVYQGRAYKGVIPKHLSGSNGAEDPIYKYKDFLLNILNSDVHVFDNWLAMFMEDKDLRFLSRQDPRVAQFLPEIVDVTGFNGRGGLSDWVLKIRDTHCGRGVIISPNRADLVDDAILQKRVYANRHPVNTVHGEVGNGIYDTGVHVSYSYDIEKRQLTVCEVAGYLTRFSLNSDIVNISQGGGLIPTLIEK
ncbi:MAG: hypothetical protein Q8N99_05520 [Nanoarchaeota archaeon]|nr:hypothetical protein [Nanoarchaeota archaeon]